MAGRGSGGVVLAKDVFKSRRQTCLETYGNYSGFLGVFEEVAARADASFSSRPIFARLFVRLVSPRSQQKKKGRHMIARKMLSRWTALTLPSIVIERVVTYHLTS